MRKTITQKVVDKITTSPQGKFWGKDCHILPHKSILRLSGSEDSATRRLREKAESFRDQFNRDAYMLHDGKYVIEPKFVSWLRQQ
jgi:hypothetical protein